MSSLDMKSWMWEHTREEHGGLVGADDGREDYRFRVPKTFRKCLDRQMDEDIQMQIRTKEGYKLLNSINEYYTPKSVEPIFRQL